MAIEERIAVVNHPSAPQACPWSLATLSRLRELGFTTVQLNIAWGYRPGGEPLNLEDVVALSPEHARMFPERLEPGSDPTGLEDRRRRLAERLAAARAAGLRTIFQFGAPFNQGGIHGGAPPNCICDQDVVRRYELLLEALHSELPVDDLWLYTYDQDAWLCSEFEECPRCRGSRSMNGSPNSWSAWLHDGRP